MLLSFENWVSTTGYQFYSYHPSYIICVASVLILRSFLFLQGRPHLLCPIAPSCLFAAHWLRLRLVLLWRSPVNLDFSLQCASGRLIRWVHLFMTENLNHLDGCCASHMLLFFENWLSTTGYQPTLLHKPLRCICAHTCSLVASLLRGNLASDSERVSLLRPSGYFLWVFPFYA